MLSLENLTFDIYMSTGVKEISFFTSLFDERVVFKGLFLDFHFFLSFFLSFLCFDSNNISMTFGSILAKKEKVQKVVINESPFYQQK